MSTYLWFQSEAQGLGSPLGLLTDLNDEAQVLARDDQRGQAATLQDRCNFCQFAWIEVDNLARFLIFHP